jgi:cytolysin-activating lysine-acyltransferase
MKHMSEPSLDLNTKANETFGQVAIAMMGTPRYRHLAIADLTHLVFEPLLQDRVAIAQTGSSGSEPDGNTVGIAIYATVSEEVDKKLREQIAAGVFPVRLKAEEWASGNINWLLDVIAPTQVLTAAVVSNIKQVIKESQLFVHPVVAKLVGPEMLNKAARPAAEKSAA